MQNTESVKNEKKSKKNVVPHAVDSSKKIEELKQFLNSFDPYSPIGQEDKNFLHSLNIYELDDPFKLTNKLISLIEDLLEREQSN